MIGNLLKKLWESVKKRGWQGSFKLVLVAITTFVILGLVSWNGELSSSLPFVKSLSNTTLSTLLVINSLLLLLIAYNTLDVSGHLDKLSKRIEFETDIENLVVKCPSLVTSKLAKRLTEQLFRKLKPDGEHNQLSADDKWATLEMYEVFWEIILESQCPKKSSEMLPTTTNSAPSAPKCLAINSTALDVWLGVNGDNFLNIQKKFHQCNGTVRRILCYKGTDFDDDTKEGENIIKKVAKKMIDGGAEVFFYDILSNKVSHPYDEWDFLVVDSEEGKASIIWKAAKLGEGEGKIAGEPKEVICSGDDYYPNSNGVFKPPINLTGLWYEIEDSSVRLELTEDGSSVRRFKTNSGQ